MTLIHKVVSSTHPSGASYEKEGNTKILQKVHGKYVL